MTASQSWGGGPRQKSCWGEWLRGRNGDRFETSLAKRKKKKPCSRWGGRATAHCGKCRLELAETSSYFYWMELPAAARIRAGHGELECWFDSSDSAYTSRLELLNTSDRIAPATASFPCLYPFPLVPGTVQINDFSTRYPNR